MNSQVIKGILKRGIAHHDDYVSYSKIMLSNNLISLTGLTKCFGSLIYSTYSSKDQVAFHT